MFRKMLLMILIIVSGLNFVIAQTESNEPTTETEKINDHLYKITCKGNNVAHVIASVGDDGVLLIDAGFTSTVAVLKKELEKLGGLPKFVINTHAHLDHMGGNLGFPGAVIIAHEDAKRMMTTGLYILYAIPEYAIPTVTFSDEMTLYFNGETVKIIHVPGSHTMGDAIVHFVESDVVALGDLIFPDWYPFIDLANGGTLTNYVENINYFIEDYSANTIFIAGHGRTFSIDDLKKYKVMLDETVKLVEQAIADGKDYNTMVDEDLLKDWESYNSGPFRTIKKDYWIGTIYSCLTGERVVGKPAVIGEIIDVWMTNGVDAAITKYKSLKQNNINDYDFNEAYLNALGYYLMGRNILKDAIAILQLNVEEYPGSANVYDSLGEAYAKDGQKKLAIASYEKSLQLDSTNSNAVDRLTELKSE